MGQQQTNLSVLVVNDEPNQLIVVQEVLRDAGLCVLTAADGDEGFDVAKLEHPDLVISDVTMPRVSGIELCRLIRSDDELDVHLPEDDLVPSPCRWNLYLRAMRCCEL